MPPLAIKVARLTTQKVKSPGTARTIRKPAWRVLGPGKRHYLSLRKVKFESDLPEQNLPTKDDEDGSDIPVKPREPVKGDFAIIFSKAPGKEKFSSGLAHLVPRHLLDHDGAVFCYDESITDGNPWVQVLPIDKSGEPILRATTECSLQFATEGEEGDVIAIQAVPDNSKSKSDDEIQDFGIRVTWICGRFYRRWDPVILGFALVDEDDVSAIGDSPTSAPVKDGKDDEDDLPDEEAALQVTYVKIKPRVASSSWSKDRTARAIEYQIKATALAKEAEELRKNPSSSKAERRDFSRRAGACAEGVLQFMEDGAPSPTFGPTTWISALGTGSQIVESPMPDGGYGNVPKDYIAPETPIKDGFGLVAAPADLVCLVGALAKSIHRVVKLTNDTELTEDERNKLVVSEFCTIYTYLGHMGVAGIGVADIAYSGWVAAEKAKLVGENLHNLETAAQQTSQHLTIASSVVGVVVGVYVTARNSVKAHKARKRGNKVHVLLKEVKGKLDQSEPHERALTEHLSFAEKKLRRTKYKTAFTATAAAIGTAGSTGGLVVAALGTVAIANAWNPVGWTIFGAGLAVGLGVTSYVLFRRFRRSKRHKHRRSVSRPENARIYAINLAQAYLDPMFRKHQPEDWGYIDEHLHHIGISDTKLKARVASPTPDNFKKLVRHIERKMPS